MKDVNFAVVAGTATAGATFGTTSDGTPVANVRMVVVTERIEAGAVVAQRDYFNCSYYAADARELFGGVEAGDRLCLVGRLRSGRTVGADGSHAYHATLVASAASIYGKRGESHGTDNGKNGD